MATFPASIFRYASAPTITSNVPVTLTESRSLITYARETPAQRWEIEVDGFVLPSDKNEFNGFLMQNRGPLGTFLYSIPIYGESQAPNTTTTLAATKGATEVSVDAALMVGIGDFFTFAGHEKLYQVTGVTGAVVEFFPRLKSNVALGETVNFETPQIRVRLRSNQKFGGDGLPYPTNYSLAMMEVL